MKNKLTEQQRNQLHYIKSRADFLKSAMKDVLPDAHHPIVLIESAVKEFEQRLSMRNTEAIQEPRRMSLQTD